tara:strand:- start:110 stop:652 length:543 start_codon:yes stop_codon:yes gene_type:complete
MALKNKIKSKTKNFKKIKSFNTHGLKEKILGDWLSILNFPLIIFFYYMWFNPQKWDTPDSSNFIIALMIVPAVIGLFCLFKYSKEYKYSKFGLSFWIILLGFLWWAFIGSHYETELSMGRANKTILHDAIFYGSLLIGFIINLSKIKNFFKATSYTFGQIPFIFIALFFVKAGMNALKRR